MQIKFIDLISSADDYTILDMSLIGYEIESIKAVIEGDKTKTRCSKIYLDLKKICSAALGN